MGDFVTPGANGLDQPTSLFFVPRTRGDIDGDGAVGTADLLSLLSARGTASSR